VPRVAHRLTHGDAPRPAAQGGWLAQRAEAQRWFDERELAELALLNAIENFYNAMNLALGIDRSDGLEALAREAAAV
jgi:hypothetical protein